MHNSLFTYLASQFSYDERANLYTAEMSSLGLRPGDLPPYLYVQGEDATGLTTSERFRFLGAVSDRGDLQFIMYISNTGCKVKLFND